MTSLSFTALREIPLIKPGDDLPQLLAAALHAQALDQAPGTLLIAQKIVSKAEGRYRRLNEVKPSPRAVEIASQAEKDPKLVELILEESSRVVRCAPGRLIVEHRCGCILANAGIDSSNVPPDASGAEQVLLWPRDPETSARILHERLQQIVANVGAVIICDSLGRPWRMGTVGFAIGSAGIETLRDCVNQPDLYGRPLQVTQIAIADQLAAAASLAMGEGNEGTPAVFAGGAFFVDGHVKWSARSRGADLLRPHEEDLFQ